MNWTLRWTRVTSPRPVKVSIIIPAFNEERLLADTLRAVRAASVSFTRRGWLTEVIVCDNNSTDRTAGIARDAGVTVVFEPQNQIARARNRGASAASGEWLIFIDADSHPSPELFNEVAAQIESDKCIGGGSTVTLQGHYPVGSRFAAMWNWTSRVFRWMAGSFIFCEAAAFREIGGFSEELFASEEINFSSRLKAFARGRKKKVVILHRHPIITSARKVHLYSVREHVWFLLKVLFTGGRILGSREACHTWYDGRR